jgi:hypothetical protein
MLSDQTHIYVKTGVENAVDADGKKIINYNVDFTYEVEEEFSARDDFKSGRYHVEESNAAMIMLKIMTQAFEKDFAKYMVAGKQVKIKVKGSADASPIHHTLAYDGKYGEYDGEPVYMNNELTNIILTKKGGIETNEQLAFARALGVQNYIEKEISSFSDIEATIRDKTPVPMLVNAGITHWHWILVVGIRKYMNGDIYLNILDGWNKRNDRYLKYTGRETFIRALKPTM